LVQPWDTSSEAVPKVLQQGHLSPVAVKDLRQEEWKITTHLANFWGSRHMSFCSNRALLTLQRTLLVFLRAWYHEVGAHSHCSSTETRCHCQIRDIAPRGGCHLGSGHFLNVSCDLIEGRWGAEHLVQLLWNLDIRFHYIQFGVKHTPEKACTANYRRLRVASVVFNCAQILSFCQRFHLQRRHLAG